MASKATLENYCAVIRAASIPYPEISQECIDALCAIVKGEMVAVKHNSTAQLEPPMTPDEASELTHISKQALNYHARMGRIRRVKPAGARRSLGYVAADIRALLEGRVA